MPDDLSVMPGAHMSEGERTHYHREVSNPFIHQWYGFAYFLSE